MPRDGAVTLSDLKAQGLTRLEVACAKCGRRGAYGLAGLMRRNGDAKLTDLLQSLTVECPHGKGASVYDRCEAFYPALRLPSV